MGSEKWEVGSDDAPKAARAVIRSYRDIDAYKRSMALLAPLHTLIRRLPKEEQWELASQLRRASKSVPANIAEGYGKKRSAREFRSFLSNALGSSNEMVVQLEIAVAVGYLTSEEVAPFVDEYELIGRQLYRLSETWRDFSANGNKEKR